MRKLIIIIILIASMLFVSCSGVKGKDIWKQLYIDYINEIIKNYEGDYNTYTLIFVNDDDIPELIMDDIQGNSEICIILDGKIETTMLWRYHQYEFSYLERRGAFIVSEPQMDSYYDEIYGVENNKIVLIHYGVCEYNTTYNADEDDYDCDYTYSFDNIEVSESEYSQKLNAAYDFSKAKELDEKDFYSGREMIEIINKY